MNVNVQQTAEFATDFLENANMPEAETLVQLHTCVASLGNSCNERMEPQTSSYLNDGGL